MPDLIPIDLEPLTKVQLEKIESDTGRDAFIWPIPGSKSITNRALILAALSPFTVTLQGVLHSDDTKHMTNALLALGVDIKTEKNTVTVNGGLPRIKTYLNTLKDDLTLFIGNSGTTVRFLTSFLVFLNAPINISLVGDEHMAKRPISDLTDAITAMTGTTITFTGNKGCPPLLIHAANSDSKVCHKIQMNGEKSSQYFTSLMMSAHMAVSEALHIEVTGTLISVPYVEMTRKMMDSFGLKSLLVYVEGKAKEIVVFPRSEETISELVYDVEPDGSAASYAFAAAVATRSTVTVRTGCKESLQGDFKFVDILADLGCDVKKTDETITVTGKPLLLRSKFTVDMGDISDTVMTLAALAPLASGSIRIENVANIRIKETDRLEATVNELNRLGQQVSSGPDWLEVVPTDTCPARVECYSDHRMAMAFAILGLVKPGITIKDTLCVNKTYPDFWEHLQLFRASLT